jgi:hypothetical protein
MKNLSIGDVFIAPESFAFGQAESVSEQKYIKGKSRIRVSDSYDSIYKVMATESYDPKTGNAITALSTKWDRSNKSRPGKKFIVEDVKMTGGSEREFIQDAPFVTARRLKNDGTYDPNGELVVFYDGNSDVRYNSNVVTITNVVHKMQKIFV